VAEPAYKAGTNPTGADPIEVVPVVVLSQVFPARPSSIPDIRDFVRRCLAESPLTDEGNREVGETVFRALLDAAGPTGSIQVAFRIFPEHVEVDVLHSDNQILGYPPQGAHQATAAGAPNGTTPTVRSGPVTPGRTPGEPATADQSAALTPAEPVPIGEPGQAATFAEWMSTALRREGMTQEAAARQLGVSVKTVSRWVGGATEPRMRDLRRIQEVFGQVPLP
jgi:DNA-binding XRE family transcriptional regulator